MHPDKIGPYLIDRKIGAGGMGNVYHGTHEKTGEEAAVKVLPASMAREEGFVNRFSREVDALRKVSSPNIVQIFEDGKTEDGSYYFSMEFVDGETLTAMITRRRRIPWTEVIDIGLQISAALKAAHDTGIVHRDLKPSNLMISSDGTVKLADFGVAHVFATTRLTRTGGVVGTAEYMSPEQARGQRATKLSDLYSLGAVMYVMLTGRPPFTGKMASDILHKHQFAQFDKPSHFIPDVPRLLENFVCVLLEKKPAKRLPDAFVVIRQLTNIKSRIEYEDRAQAESQTQISDPSAPGRTVGLAADKTSGSVAENLESGRGPATMVRDAIREDLEKQLEKSPLARFFDNTFVLVALLVLVIGAGYLLSDSTKPDPVEELARAKELLAGKPSRAWLHTRDDILIPLRDNETFPDEQADIENLIRRANQYEFCRDLKINNPSGGTAQSELQRLVVLAFDDYGSGDVTGASVRLKTVLGLMSKDDTFLRDFLTSTLNDWNKEVSATGRKSLLHQIVQDGTAALNDIGDTDDAVRRLTFALKEYGEDATVTAEVDQCRELLKQLTENKTESDE